MWYPRRMYKTWWWKTMWFWGPYMAWFDKNGMHYRKGRRVA